MTLLSAINFIQLQVLYYKDKFISNVIKQIVLWQYRIRSIAATMVILLQDLQQKKRKEKEKKREPTVNFITNMKIFHIVHLAKNMPVALYFETFHPRTNFLGLKVNY